MPHAQLYFPPTAKIDGFTNAVTSGSVYAEGVVRELLQNALDAAISAGRRAEVHLTVASVPVDDFPGVSQYESAFDSAHEERQQNQGELTQDEQNAIDRILAVLEADEARVLFCRDNGIGLDAERMRAVLSQGNSDKPNKGAGSFGLGHLAAFAASDLRYVVYAGRRADSHVTSGHAIVATHPTGDGSTSRRSADGYWAVPEEPFNLKTAEFGQVVPQMLEEQVTLIEDSGTVVGILGFNHFREAEPRRAFRDIVRVAAVNFLGAIQERKMVVRVSDETLDADELIDHGSLEPCLAGIRGKTRSRRGTGGGWLPGEQAYRTYETRQHGEELAVPPLGGDAPDPSVRVFFRRVSSSEQTRVQVFRDGMWITNCAPHLEYHAFGLAIVFSGSPLFTGGAGSGESNIRRWIIENDWLEAVIALPEQMFYNTGIGTYIWIVTNRKAEHRRGKIQLLDARDVWTAGGSEESKRSLGDKRRHLTGSQIDAIVRLYGERSETETSKVFDNADFGYTRVTVERPLRLTYRMTLDDKARFLDACPHLLDDVQAIDRVLGRDSHSAWDAVWNRISALLRSRNSRWKAHEKKIFRSVFTEKDPDAEPVAAKGRLGRSPGYEPDPALRDFETVPLKDDIDAYFEREVRPHVPDAWMDRRKDRVGYEINFNRHFYKYTPPRPLEVR